MKKNVINLKEFRIKSGLTQKALAEKLGISLRTYQRYEVENSGLDYKKLLEISKQLGVSMDILMGSSVKNMGDNNITISGNNNQIGNLGDDMLNTPKFKEFLELFTKYGNDAALDGFIKKLKALKEISND